MKRLETTSRLANLVWDRATIHLSRCGGDGCWSFAVHSIPHTGVPRAIGRGTSLEVAATELLDRVCCKALDAHKILSASEDEQERELAGAIRLELRALGLAEDPIEWARRRVG
jgi:hypothetical protein